MTRYLAILAIISLGICGCDGSADLTIINNTPGYVNGVIDGDEVNNYGLKSGTRKTYSVAVGEGMLDNTRVNISANIHENDSPSSRVIATDKESIHMEEDHEYTYVIPYSSSSRSLRLELRSVRAKGSITGP